MDGRTKTFYAVCPACSKLLVLNDGIWPEHIWFDKHVCSTSKKSHEATAPK